MEITTSICTLTPEPTSLFFVGKGVGNRKARKPESNELRELLDDARFNGRWFGALQVVASNCRLMAIS